MLDLTTAIVIPNVQRIRVRNVEFDLDQAAAFLTVKVTLTGGIPYPAPERTYRVAVRNGVCQGLRAKATGHQGVDDYLENFDIDVPTGLNLLIQAYVGGSIAARNRGAETAGATSGWLPPGAVS